MGFIWKREPVVLGLQQESYGSPVSYRLGIDMGELVEKYLGSHWAGHFLMSH
jgi:hypothetical protein